MVYGCGNKCVKYLVFTFNFLIFVVGIAVMATSLVTVFNSDARKYFGDLLAKAGSGFSLDQMNVALYVLAAVGALLLLTGFLGCCGAWTESVCLLTLFFSIILILFIAELGCGIAILVKKDEVKKALFDEIKTLIEKYSSQKQEVKDAIDIMQKEVECCGCYGFQDYLPSGPPASCTSSTKPTQLATGCCDKIWNDLESKAAIAGGVAIGILVIELLAMIFTCILCQAFRRGDYHSYA